MNDRMIQDEWASGGKVSPAILNPRIKFMGRSSGERLIFHRLQKFLLWVQFVIIAGPMGIDTYDVLWHGWVTRELACVRILWPVQRERRVMVWYVINH